MCDTLVVVEPDRVLFAKNSDRDPNEAQLLEWQPARSHAPGTRLRCTWIEIPQARRTNAVLLSRPFWMWGAEMGANEHGLVIGNEGVFTKEPTAASGLLGMDLLRLALERADEAETAIQVITELLEAHGQGGGCGHEKRSFSYHNSFIAADPQRAFVLETAGRHWAVEEVTGGPRTISNGLTIQSFADQHSEWLKTKVSGCRLRRPLTQAGAAMAGGPGDLMAVLREHGRDIAPVYSPLNGAMAAPCMHAGGLAAASQTTASWVSELWPDGARHWATATAAPCTSVFKPAALDRPVDLGPAPTDQFDARTLWWRHEVLHRAVLQDPERLLPPLAAERDELEARWLADPPGSAEAFAEADAFLRRWSAVVGQPVNDTRPWYVRRYWQVRAQRAGLPSPGLLEPERVAG